MKYLNLLIKNHLLTKFPQVFKGMGGAMDLVSNPDATKIVVTTDPNCFKIQSSTPIR